MMIPGLNCCPGSGVAVLQCTFLAKPRVPRCFQLTLTFPEAIREISWDRMRLLFFYSLCRNLGLFASENTSNYIDVRIQTIIS